MLTMKNQIRLVFSFAGGGGGLLMDQSNPCFYTKGDLTKPHLATRSNIFSNVCAKSFTCIGAILLHHFFSKGYKFCDYG